MSNYISSTNQTILWNTVNRIPAFMQLSPDKRDSEFKRIIEYFYRENVVNTPVLSIPQLQELNRKTVVAFLQIPVKSVIPALPVYRRENPEISESSVFETRQEKQERAFQERQNMYAQMTEKPNLPSADIFKEKEADEKITNMDELIENYQKQRNLEIPVIPPVIPLAKKKNITFLEGNVELNSLEIQDLSAEGASRDNAEKKNLAWNINLEETRIIEDSYLQELEKRIASLEKQIQLLSERENERKLKMQEKQIQTESESEIERKEIEEIIESVILSIK